MSTTLLDAPAVAAGTAASQSARVNPARRGPVLLACDGHEASGAPVVAARLIAERLGVPLEVVSVLEPQVIYGVALGGTPIYLPEVEEAQRSNREIAVRDYLSRFSGGAAPVPLHLRFGGIADEVATVARERNATLVVMGAAPHQRVNRIVAGERAVQVLRVASCPVLSVPPGFTALPRAVMVAVDFAPASVRATQAALLLLADGGTLTLLHVLSPLLGDAPLRDPDGGDPANTVQALFGRLRDQIRPYVPADVTVETRIHTAETIDGILSSAMSLGAGLIAVGTHGPRLLERLFMGSVASSIVHTAPEAVLAAPPPAPAEALALWLRVLGTATSSQPRDWREALDAFTRRHVGRRVTVEVDDPDLGAQMLARGATLVGVTYDPHDRRVEIMLGDPASAKRHVMHSIPKVESIAMTVDDRTQAEVLELRHGHGHTLVLVAP